MKEFKIYEAFNEFKPMMTSRMGQLRNLLRVNYQYSTSSQGFGAEIVCPEVSLFDLYLNCVLAGFNTIVIYPDAVIDGKITGKVFVDAVEGCAIHMIKMKIGSNPEDTMTLNVSKEALQQAGII